MSTRSEGNALIDDCDRRILAALVRNARISFKKLAEIAQLSGNATAERVQRLQQMSVITGFKAELNRKLLGHLSKHTSTSSCKEARAWQDSRERYAPSRT